MTVMMPDSNPSIHRFTASDGADLAWHELGQGRAVLLLHGLFSSADMNWIRFGHAAEIASFAPTGRARRRMTRPPTRRTSSLATGWS
jgi:pimeloyl-ACP methyl ester carboxylesterase